MPESSTAVCLAHLRADPALSSSFLYFCSPTHLQHAGCTQAAHPEDCATNIKDEPAIHTAKHLFHVTIKCALLSNSRKDKTPERGSSSQACYSECLNLCLFLDTFTLFWKNLYHMMPQYFLSKNSVSFLSKCSANFLEYMKG